MQNRTTSRLLGAAGLAAVLAAGVSGLAPTADAAPRQSTAAADPVRTWSLASDMAADPDGNPIADSYGNPAVWSWGAGTDAASYRLDDQVNSEFGPEFGPDCNSASSSQLHVHTSADSGGLPLVGYYGGDDPFACGTVTVPPHSVDVHPSPTEDAIIAWTSPIDGTVSVSGTVADNDPNGGDGFDYQLLDGSTQLAAADVDNGGSADVSSNGDVTVAKGDTLYLLVGNRAEYTYDSTRVDLTITAGPNLLAAAPQTVFQGQTKSVRLYGRDFAEGATVSLDDQTGVTLGKTTLTRNQGANKSQDLITVPVSVSADAPATLRNWQVTNPDGGTTTCSTKNCVLIIGETPTVSNVEPSKAPQAQTTSIALTGSGLSDGLKVSVSGLGVTVSNVQVQDENHATFDLAVTPTAKLGARTLKVYYPKGGSSSYKKRVSVTAAAQ